MAHSQVESWWFLRAWYESTVSFNVLSLNILITYSYAKDSIMSRGVRRVKAPGEGEFNGFVGKIFKLILKETEAKC